MKSFLVLLVIALIACWVVTDLEARFPVDFVHVFAREAKKYKFCTKVCSSLKGHILGPLKPRCLKRCRDVRQSAIIQGTRVLVCKRLCEYFKNSPFYQTCHRSCNNLKKHVVVKAKQKSK